MSKALSRQDYIVTLKTQIENDCYGKIHTDRALSRKTLNNLRAILLISVGLERMADCFVSITRQIRHLKEPTPLIETDIEQVFETISQSIGLIRPALKEKSMAKALAICRVEPELDQMYEAGMKHTMAAIEEGGEAQALITALFVLQHLERTGDELLNIGEAILFAILGERIRIDQFESLQKTLSISGVSDSVSDIDFKAIRGTRSGCHVGRINKRPTENETPADIHGSIYKEGPLEKIEREQENNRRWQATHPGLVPAIYAFHEEGEKGSLLIEDLSGSTLDEVLLSGDAALADSAFQALETTLAAIWTKTLALGPTPTNYIPQIQARLSDVLEVHPQFFRKSQAVGSATVHSVHALLETCTAIEKKLDAPFTVFIHGDFNINNVVYNPATRQIHYIDLHRSRNFDYIQDASVFLVSQFRIPIFDRPNRTAINLGIQRCHTFFRAFAEQQRDASFEARLALGLARSFYTSTRFELNAHFARDMYNRALFLLEKLHGFKGHDWSGFTLPEEILYY